jgi:NlpC/P60 family putative phage cell wall peptidase
MDLQQRVVDEARSWIGTPYRHQASIKSVACDCLGLVRGVWRGLYGCEPEALKPYSADWAEAGGADALLEAARRHFIQKPIADMTGGDVILLRWKPGHSVKHLGILVSDQAFIHAYEGHAVMISALVPQWRGRIAGVFSFKPIKD